MAENAVESAKVVGGERNTTCARLGSGPGALERAGGEMKTEAAVENLVDAFCKLSNPEYKDLYTTALQSIVRMAKAEQLLEMQRDFNRCMDLTS